jgi:hypothetical protein
VKFRIARADKTISKTMNHEMFKGREKPKSLCASADEERGCFRSTFHFI